MLVLNSPASFGSELSQLDGVTVQRDATPKFKTSFAIGFAITEAERDAISSTFARVADGDAVIWIAYPKGTSKTFKCEFNRDCGWTVLGKAGFETVRQVAIDEDWSALRFRKVEYVKSLNRSNSDDGTSKVQRRTMR